MMKYNADLCIKAINLFKFANFNRLKGLTFRSNYTPPKFRIYNRFAYLFGGLN